MKSFSDEVITKPQLEAAFQNALTRANRAYKWALVALAVNVVSVVVQAVLVLIHYVN